MEAILGYTAKLCLKMRTKQGMLIIVVYLYAYFETGTLSIGLAALELSYIDQASLIHPFLSFFLALAALELLL